MPQIREVARVVEARETVEGAGVRLRRVFGHRDVPLFDPFLMLDDFRSDRPEDHLAGFPWHPHRGIETVTIMLDGRVEHGDSIGNAGSIGAGDVQWMTAGSGIVHQEMPKPVDGKMGGFQLWVNLPRSHKMMEPRYQEIRAADIPVVGEGTGVTVRVIAGRREGIVGPVREIVAEPDVFDVTMAPGAVFVHGVRPGHTVSAYIIGGSGRFGALDLREYQCALFGDGDEVRIGSPLSSLRFLFFSGRPIREPIAWSGPIVMNNREELEEAFREYREGTFVRAR